jgi:hypothetical protein
VDFPDVVLYSVPLFILLMVAERVSYLWHRDDEELGYGLRTTGFRACSRSRAPADCCPTP